MLFKKAFALFSVALCVSAKPVKRALTAAQIVDNINIVTSKSQNLQTPAGQINLVNGALALIGQGPVPV
jgi:hypothetical protein